MHLPFSETQQPICFSCWGVVKHPFIHSFSKAHDTAVGPDGIHYQLLKYLSDCCLKILLDIFNKLWDAVSFCSCLEGSDSCPYP